MSLLISEFEESLAAAGLARQGSSSVVAIDPKSTNAVFRRTSPQALGHCRQGPVGTNTLHEYRAAQKTADTDDRTIPFLIHHPPYPSPYLRNGSAAPNAVRYFKSPVGACRIVPGLNVTPQPAFPHAMIPHLHAT